MAHTHVYSFIIEDGLLFLCVLIKYEDKLKGGIEHLKHPNKKPITVNAYSKLAAKATFLSQAQESCILHPLFPVGVSKKTHP